MDNHLVRVKSPFEWPTPLQQQWDLFVPAKFFARTFNTTITSHCVIFCIVYKPFPFVFIIPLYLTIERLAVLLRSCAIFEVSCKIIKIALLSTEKDVL